MSGSAFSFGFHRPGRGDVAGLSVCLGDGRGGESVKVAVPAIASSPVVVVPIARLRWGSIDGARFS